MTDPLDHLGQQLLQTIINPAAAGSIPEKVLEQHIAILGKTGSGKTYLAKGLVESLLKRNQRVCIIDPTGVWWGLRSDSTGKNPGFLVVIFGGEHADLPLDPQAGAAIAESIGTSGISVVLDTRDLGVNERCRFFTAFAETLLRKNEGPLHVIIDESHLFMPQGRVSDPQSGRMLHAGNNLVSLGRGVGLRIMMITQRPAKLHKDSLTQAETLIALRLVAPQDRHAVEDWIGQWAEPRQGKELLGSLPSLPTGEGWVWAPELGMLERLTFPRICTFDSSKAPNGAKQKVVLSNVNTVAIERPLKFAAKDVQESDPKRLRARIAELEKQVKHSAKPIEQPVLTAADFERLAELQTGLQSAVADLHSILGILSRVATPQTKDQFRAQVSPAGHAHIVAPEPIRFPKAAVPISVKQTTASDSTSLGNSGLRRMLIALAQVYPGSLTDRKLGLRSNVSVKGGSFDSYLSKGRQNGWIEGERAALRITQAGKDALGSFEPLPTGRALLDFWLNKLGNSGVRRMLDVLARMYPHTMTAQQLGEHAGVSVNGGSFDSYLSRLRGFDLITGQRDALRASEEFFYT